MVDILISNRYTENPDMKAQREGQLETFEGQHFSTFALRNIPPDGQQVEC